MKKFETGKAYKMHSVCSDTVWTYTVIKRTACTVELNDGTETIKCRIDKRTSEYLGVEAVNPLGKYSMSPILRADREAA